MNILELQEKLKKLNIQMPDADICRIWGMDTAAFSRKKKFGSEIKHKNIQQLEEALKIDLIDRAPTTKQLSEKIDDLMKDCGLPVDNTSKTVKVCYRPDVSLSAGYGIEIYSESPDFVYVDARFFVTDKGTKINPKYCEVVKISGNSMYPEYRDGDRVIIDKNDLEFSDGHIYAFRYKNKCYVKEINLLGDKIKCISLNKEYDAFYIEENEDFQILGRILPRIRL